MPNSEIIDANGLVWGVTAGASRHILGSNWVVGVELDHQWTSQKGQAVQNFCSGTNCASGFTLTHRVKVDQFGTARVRLGYVVFDRALLYVTGGAAYGSYRFTDRFDSTSFGSDETITKRANFGRALGGGIEVALNRHLSAKVEFLDLDMGSHTVTNQWMVQKVDVTDRIIRGGINFRF